jgi:hypothetical protein
VVDFIEEVEEQLRADRYRELARRTLPWFFIALAAIIIGWVGAWGWQTWQNSRIAKASDTYNTALTALGQGDETGAFTGFATVAKDGPPGYQSLALMQQGNIRYGVGKTDEAVSLWDQAAKAAPTPMIGDLARLKAALALLDTAPYDKEAARLQVLIGEKKPFNLEAREALAMAKFVAGRTAEARTECSAVSLMLGVTGGVRARCQALIATIDAGESKATLDAAKLAATLPPPQPQTMAPPGAQGAPGAPPQSDPNAGRNAPRNAQ